MPTWVQIDDIDGITINVDAVSIDGAFDTTVVDEIIHAIETSQECRFSTTGGSDESRNLMCRQVERNISKCLEVTIKQVDIFQSEGNVIALFRKNAKCLP